MRGTPAIFTLLWSIAVGLGATAL